jgi:hypothetical protein
VAMPKSLNFCATTEAPEIFHAPSGHLRVDGRRKSGNTGER